jgi:hypothetical protein
MVISALKYIMQTGIQSFKAISMCHRSFIPYNE